MNKTILGNEKCPYCGEKPSICVWTAFVSCNNCGEVLRPLTKEEKKLFYKRLKKLEKKIEDNYHS